MVTKVDSGVIVHDGGTIKDALDKAKPIADYVALRAYTGSATQVRITNNGVSGFFYYDAADTISADNGGTIIVASNGKRWKRLFDGAVNVKWFGAKGDWSGSVGTDDVLNIQNAINVAASLKRALFIPTGNYLISATLTFPANAHMVGESRNGSIIYGQTNNFPLILLNGPQTLVENLYVRGGSVGIQNAPGAAYFSRINNCRISYNRIGVLADNAYITTISNNYISFNSYGVVSSGGSFQVIIRDNVIDNNLGGCGVFAYGTTGLVVDGNTIEGNRKEDTVGGPSVGIGMAVVGVAQRCIVSNNWFEQNGNQTSSIDLMLGKPPETWIDSLITTCIPTEYQNRYTGNVGITGLIDIRGNFYFATKYGISIDLTWAEEANISIASCRFNGTLDKYNRPISLYNKAVMNFGLTISNIAVGSLRDVASQMLSGIKKSVVYHTGSLPPYGQIMLDGTDLFTAEITLKQFSELAGSTLAVAARPNAGSYLYSGKVSAIGGTSGVRVIDTGGGRPFLGGSSLLPLGVDTYFCLISSRTGKYSYNSAGGGVAVDARDAFGVTTINKVNAGANGEITLHTGDYVGYFVMTVEQYAGSIVSGCLRLSIKDLSITEKDMYSLTSPEAYASPTRWTWSKNDIVYNSSPNAGSPLGWVCTVAGAPGTWAPFGQAGVLTSIASPPSFVLQQAVVGGIGYLATGTASTADWKQITN